MSFVKNPSGNLSPYYITVTATNGNLIHFQTKNKMYDESGGLCIFFVKYVFVHLIYVNFLWLWQETMILD